MKTKKILSLVLALAMILSTMSFNVFADVATVTDEAGLKAAVEAGSDVILGGDIAITETITVAEGQNLTINFVGHKLSIENGETGAITSSGNLTLKDTSSTPGGIYGRDNGYVYLVSITGGTATISDIYVDSDYGAVAISGGEVTINSGSFSQIDGGATRHTLYVKGGSVEINGGSFTVTENANGGYTETSNVSAYGGNIVINDGTFSKSAYASVYAFNQNSECTINGGTFAGRINVWQSTVEITDGTFNGNIQMSSSEGETVQISGGTFNGNIDMTETGVKDGLLNITGGTFKDTTNAAKVTAPDAMVDAATGEVIPAVAAVVKTENKKETTTKYATLDEALDVLAEGDTLKLATGTLDSFEIFVDNVTITGMTDDTVVTVGNINCPDPAKKVSGTALIGIDAEGVTVEGIKFVVPETVGGNLNWAASVIGYAASHYHYGGIASQGWDVKNCQFVSEGSALSYAVFNTNNFEISGNKFENFTVGIAAMGDGSALGTVVIKDNTFTKVDEPISVYWGGLATAEEAQSIAVTGNTFVSAKTEGKEITVVIDDYGYGNNGNSENQSIASVTVSDNTYEAETVVKLVDSVAGTNVYVETAENATTVKQYATDDWATANVANGEQFALEGEANKDKTFTKTGDISYSDSEGNEYSVYAVEAEGVYYSSLEEALSTIGSKDIDGEIKLLEDASLETTSSLYNSINLNGHTLTIGAITNITPKGSDDVVFSNGTIKAEDVTISGGNGLFWITGTNLIFDNVYVDMDNVSVPYAIFSTWGTPTAKFINGSVIDVNGTNMSVFAFEKGSTLIIEASEVIFNDVLTGFLQGVEITNSTVTMTDVGAGFRSGVASGVITDSTVSIDGAEYGVNLYPNITLDLNGDTTFTVTNATKGDIYAQSGAAVEKEDTVTLNAKVYNAPSETTVTENITISVEATDDERVYNIYAIADEGASIYELNDAELEFGLVGANPDAISYTITPAANIQLTSDFEYTNPTTADGLVSTQAYLFSYDGVNADDATGAKLLLGSVKFEGYDDEFTFKVVDEYLEAAVYATEFATNKVKEYKGDALICGSADVSLVEPARDVIVTVEFPNGITAGNDADYNDMTVTLTGANGEIHVGKIGCDVDDDETDNVIYADYDGEKAVFTFADVTAEYRYTFEISGAGYRTYRYTTLVGESDEALNIKFWNDAKYQGKEDVVEAGVSEATDVTFLAGDIVRDNEINKYDLSAVVSYFGTYNLSLTNHPEYNKYDLNRDGEIDSKDVAYVLVSWGK